MPKTNTKQLLALLIERSALLTQERKADLLATLPQLDEEQEQELQKILQSEDDINQDIARHAIEVAVKKGDTEFLDDLDALLSSSLKTLRSEAEDSERVSEKEDVEQLFEDMP